MTEYEKDIARAAKRKALESNWRTSYELQQLHDVLQQAQFTSAAPNACTIIPNSMIKMLLEVIAQAKHTEEGHGN
jgi:hypothetical protein